MKEINALRKEINRLLSKGISNINWKVNIEMFCKLGFSGFKKFVTRSIFGELKLMEMSLNFKTYCCNLKIRCLEAKLWMAFVFNFKRNYDVLKSNSPCILLNKNINFDKNQTELKMENHTHNFREMDLVLQLM